MSRYYFDTKIGGRCVQDADGTEVEAFDVAKEMAIRALPGMVRDAFCDGVRDPVVVKIRDESGQVRFQAKLTLETCVI